VRQATWNPLEDDGDAFRLAVKLGLDLRTADSSYAFAGMNMAETGLGYCECLGDNPFTANRRAIVRAAAEIGRSIP
jgi:hypothetical protein